MHPNILAAQRYIKALPAHERVWAQHRFDYYTGCADPFGPRIPPVYLPEPKRRKAINARLSRLLNI